MAFNNLLTAITSRVSTTLISASSKVHVTIEYHVMCLVFCMYSTLYSVQYGEISLSLFHILSYFFKYDKLIFLIMII